MRAFPSLIGGQDQEHDNWIHMIKADALLTDTFGALALKRDLDAGGASPDDDRVIGRVGITSPAQVEEALRLAREASYEWGATSLDHRFALASAMHDALKAHADEFVELLVEEGHPRRVAEWEVDGVISGSSPRTFQASRHFMRRDELVGQREIVTQRKADGVVCLHPPKNAPGPTSLLGTHVLVGGNSLVVKAPRSCPVATMWAWREVIAPLLDEFDAPKGTLAVICGNPAEIIDQWLGSPDVDDIFYFGGSETGLEIERRCVENGKKPVLELSGNDGLLVWKDADIRRAAIAASECFYGSAQICMVPKYVLVHSAVIDEFERELLEAIKDLRPGLPSAKNAMLAPVLRTDQFFADIEEAVLAGAEVVTGGRRTDLDGNEDAAGMFLQPTVLRIKGMESARDLRAVREETFFPLLPVVVVEGESDESLWVEVLRFLNANAYGLRNSIWTTDDNLKADFIRRVHNGGVLKINDSHLGFVDGMPTFGGVGRTGGVFGEANYPILRTTHLQAAADASRISSDAVFSSLWLANDAT